MERLIRVEKKRIGMYCRLRDEESQRSSDVVQIHTNSGEKVAVIDFYYTTGGRVMRVATKKGYTVELG